jgi:hypothetical protein
LISLCSRFGDGAAGLLNFVAAHLKFTEAALDTFTLVFRPSHCNLSSFSAFIGAVDDAGILLAQYLPCQMQLVKAVDKHN